VTTNYFPLHFLQQIPEKEEFRKYLEKSGVVDALTNVLVSLYEEPEKPADALDYVRKQLGSIVGIDVDGLKRENEQLSAKVKDLSAQVADLTKKLEAAGSTVASSSTTATPTPTPAAAAPAPAASPDKAVADEEKK
jgi:seryl-tRNA synthetase